MSWLTKVFGKGIDDVLADFQKVVKRLEEVKKAHISQNHFLLSEKVRIQKEMDKHASEITRAENLLTEWRKLV